MELSLESSENLELKPDEIKIVVRPMVSEDRPFIITTWLRGQIFGCGKIDNFFVEVNGPILFKEYEKRVNEVLSDPFVDVLIASDQNKSVWACGYSVIIGPAIYWVYVKPEYRNLGIAKKLIGDRDIKEVKSYTLAGRAIAHKKHWVFNPK